MNKTSEKLFSEAEVAKHNTDADCWVIVGGMVFDVTNFLDDHPGGKASIIPFAGKDATEAFDMLH
jgi:cytochrome b involved in lipid metabolism